MSPNRRDILKLAAGLGLTAAIPTSAERIAAAEALNQKISDDVLRDPSGFAEEAQLLIGYHSEFTNEWIGAICPEESAKERQALHFFEEDWPAIAKNGRTSF